MKSLTAQEMKKGRYFTSREIDAIVSLVRPRAEGTHEGHYKTERGRKFTDDESFILLEKLRALQGA